MKENKIIHVVLGKANPNRQNGVNKVVFELAMDQSDKGHDVTVWGITYNPVVNFPERTFKTRLFKDSRLKFKIAQELKQAIKYSQQGTVFHLHGGFLPQLFIVSRLLKKHRCDYIYTPHGAFNSEALKRSKWKKTIYSRLFEKVLVANARFVHVIGKSEIKGTRSLFGSSSRIELVPNGHSYSKSIFPKIHNNGEETNFGFIGRLEMHTKGLDILVNGFKEFLDNGGLGKLHIAGTGSDEDEVKLLIKENGIEDFVVFYGALFGIYKDQFLSGLDYLCLTSRNEGLPGVVLEAMGTKIPCIVSQETNIGDFIAEENAGFVLESNAPKFLSQAMRKAVIARETSKYRLLCFNAFFLVHEHFQWSIVSDKLIQKFHES
ncbi:MAG: glycosyltransferase [Crocinitomicaceae bacterium]|nr:glycosyltransferase [Crocinitomicaceae bacterium]